MKKEGERSSEMRQLARGALIWEAFQEDSRASALLRCHKFLIKNHKSEIRKVRRGQRGCHLVMDVDGNEG
jgi:hypothetical protein